MANFVLAGYRALLGGGIVVVKAAWDQLDALPNHLEIVVLDVYQQVVVGDPPRAVQFAYKEVALHLRGTPLGLAILYQETQTAGQTLYTLVVFDSLNMEQSLGNSLSRLVFDGLAARKNVTDLDCYDWTASDYDQLVEDIRDQDAFDDEDVPWVGIVPS